MGPAHLPLQLLVLSFACRQRLCQCQVLLLLRAGGAEAQRGPRAPPPGQQQAACPSTRRAHCRPAVTSAFPPPSTRGTELSSATALDSSLCPPPRPRRAIVTPPAPLSPPQPRDSGPAPRVPSRTWVAAPCPALTPPGTAPERAAALPPRSETKPSPSAGTSPRKKTTPKHPKNPASPLTRPFCSTAAGGEVLGAWDVVALPL